MTEKNTKRQKKGEGRASRGAAAYRIIDIEELPDEVRDDIRADAEGGGGLYGLRVVEVAINGPAQFPIFGIYEDDEDLWEDAQSELGFTGPSSDSDKVTDATARRAEEEADRVKRAEQDELDKIGKGVQGGPKGQAETDRTDKPTK